MQDKFTTPLGKFIVLALAFCLCRISAQPASPAGFREFSGYCQGNQSPLLTEAVSWDRHDFAWSKVEPKQGEWQDDVLQKWGDRVLQAHTAGQTMLPVLAYNAPWSWDRNARSYEYGDTRHEFTPRPDGRFDVRLLKRNPEGKWSEDKISISKGDNRWPLAVEHVPDWENYVRRMVTFFRAKPYQLEYFQIWNEAHPKSGFWKGSLDDYMTRVHLPAAKIIRELGGKVVYGGWPCCGSIGEYTEMLDRHQAWQSIDVHDMHYFGPLAFEHLQQAATQRKLGTLNIWQTELGFRRKKSFIGEDYPRFLRWGLEQGWIRKDQYKLFFFACWTPDDPRSYGYGKCLLHSKKLAPHGQSLVTLSYLLRDEPIQLAKGIQTEPVLEEGIFKPTGLEAFRVGDRLIIALHVPGNLAQITVHVPAKTWDTYHAERIDLAGGRRPLPIIWKGGVTTVKVPIAEAKDSPAKDWFSPDQKRSFYLELRPRK